MRPTPPALAERPPLFREIPFEVGVLGAGVLASSSPLFQLTRRAHSEIHAYICVFPFPYCFLQQCETDTPVHFKECLYLTGLVKWTCLDPVQNCLCILVCIASAQLTDTCRFQKTCPLEGRHEVLSLVFVDIDFQSGQPAARSVRHVKVVQRLSCIAEGHVCSKATFLALELSVMKTCGTWQRIEHSI